MPKRQRGPDSQRGDRLFIDAVLFRAKTGQSWRDLPEHFGPWKTVYNRFARWADKGYWADMFKLKRFRAIATRYEKTAQNYLALVQLACAWLWLC